MAANTLWCFLVPLVVVVCTASAASITSEEEFVNPIPLIRATNFERTRKCPSKEHWDKCGAHCQRNCTNFNDHPGVCPLPCVPGCVCEPGYVRGANGRCVKSKECPGSKKCPRGERYDPCSYLCQKNCTNHQSNEPCVHSCHPGCVCPEGHVRSVFPSGKCIKVEKCPKRTDDWIFNEDPDDSEERDDALGRDEDPDDSEERDDALGRGSFCPKNEEFVKCDAKYEPNCGNTPLSKSICVPGCRCISGYVRGPRGTCILKEVCPQNDNTVYPVKRICPRHESWNKYIAHCQKNCTHPHDLPCLRVAVSGCICEKGFLRRDDGKCVPKGQCPKTRESEQSWEDEQHEDPDDSEEDIDDALGKGSFCPKNEEFVKCDAKYEPDCGNTPLSKSVCVSGCRCESGYVRGPRGTCIKKEECPEKDNTEYPVKRICPRQEYWDQYNAHCQKNCTHPQQRPCVRIPVPGCVCKRGFLRSDDGKCVLKRQCPKKLGTDISTEEPSWLRTTHYDHDEKSWRNEEDWDAKDKSYCPPNEVFSACFGHCEPDCKNKSMTLEDCNKSVCVSDCKCLWGFVRGPKGDCIKPDKCPDNDKTKYPVKRKCPAKEQWETSRAHCQTNCTTLGKKIPCAKIAVAGCVCKKDTYRNRKGECVPRRQCPKKAEEFDVSTDDDLTTQFSTDEPSWLHPNGDHDIVENRDVNDAREEFDVSTDDDLTTEFSTDEPSWLHSNGDHDIVENRDVNDARDEVLEGRHGCPSEDKCSEYCRRHGKNYGRCLGSRWTCYCIS